MNEKVIAPYGNLKSNKSSVIVKSISKNQQHFGSTKQSSSPLALKGQKSNCTTSKQSKTHSFLSPSRVLRDKTKNMNQHQYSSSKRAVEVEEVYSPVEKIISTKPNETEESASKHSNQDHSLTMGNLVTTEDAQMSAGQSAISL